MNPRSPKIAFLVLLAALMAAFCAMVRPFLLPALFAMLIAVICDPIYRFFFRLIGRWRYLASFIATVIVTVCVLAPLAIVVGVVIVNISGAIDFITSQLQGGQAASNLDAINAWLNAKRDSYAAFLPADINFREAMLSFLTSFGKAVYQYSPKVISATANVASGFMLMIVFIFVFFADGGRFYHAVFGLLPLADEHKSIIASEIRSVISATFLGQMATSLAQGLLIGIGFWIAGISNPLLWGIVAVGVTLVPVIGGPLMYVPAAAALFMGGETTRGLFLFLYGVGIVSMVDNIIKPLILRGKVDIHPLLLALSLIGGGLWLGASGIIIGPLVVVLMLAMLKIYQKEFIS